MLWSATKVVGRALCVQSSEHGYGARHSLEAIGTKWNLDSLQAAPRTRGSIHRIVQWYEPHLHDSIVVYESFTSWAGETPWRGGYKRLPVFFEPNTHRCRLHSQKWNNPPWFETEQCADRREYTNENRWFWFGHWMRFSTFEVKIVVRHHKLFGTRGCRSQRIHIWLGHMGMRCHGICTAVRVHTIRRTRWSGNIQTHFVWQLLVSQFVESFL